ncbi:MAG: hypothetical protein J0H79_15475 [Alphaproteobacteria bacterium]|nr:hypothetical protein [Alphaproteobacteria bacterium]
MAILRHTAVDNFGTLDIIPTQMRKRGPAIGPGMTAADNGTYRNSFAIIYRRPFGTDPYLFWSTFDQPTIGM